MIKRIYCAVHLGFERLNKIGGKFQFMEGDSFYKYQEVKHQQELLLKIAIDDPEAAIIYVPVFASFSDTSTLEWYDEALVRSSLNQINDLKVKMGDRFLVVIDSHTENPSIDLLQPLKGYLFNIYNKVLSLTSTRQDLVKQIRFDYEPNNTQFIYFGERTSGCVDRYGKRIADLLSIPPQNLEIVKEASVDFDEIRHEAGEIDEFPLK